MEDIFNDLKEIGVGRAVRRRTILLYQGEIPRSAYYIETGVLKAYTINSAGNEQIVAFYTAGDVVPMSWIFGKGSSALYYFEALTDCNVVAVDKQALQQLVYSKPRHLVKTFDYLMSNYTGLLIRITSLEQSRASEKLVFTLYYLLLRYGKEQKPGVYVVRLGLTHAVIADMVGLTRETAAVELNKLKKQGVIKYTAKEYVINKEALERLMGDDSFSQFLNG